VKIAILGGGISGVALARMLAADGHRVTVLEKRNAPAGCARAAATASSPSTKRAATSSSARTSRSSTGSWSAAAARRATVRTVRNTKIRWHDRWVPYPFENGVGHLTKEAIVDCLSPATSRPTRRGAGGAPCPTNFGDWIQWRMGAGFARHFMVPYNEKIWKCDLTHDGERLGRRPRARSADRGHRQVGVGLDTEGYTHQSVFWFPKHGGFETMVRGTVEGGGFTLQCGVAVQRVERTAGGFRVDGEAFDLVVNTVPLPQIEPVIADLPEAIRAEIRQLRPISLVNVMIGVALDEPLPPLSWIYLPFAEQGPTNRVTYFSNYSPHNAPAGHGSFLAEVTHRGDTAPGCGLAARGRPRPRQRRHPASRRIVLLEVVQQRVRLHRPEPGVPGPHLPGAQVVRRERLHHLRALWPLRVPQQRPVRGARHAGAPPHPTARCQRAPRAAAPRLTGPRSARFCGALRNLPPRRGRRRGVPWEPCLSTELFPVLRIPS
jgi:protoporphyrinogen oxidase